MAGDRDLARQLLHLEHHCAIRHWFRGLLARAGGALDDGRELVAGRETDVQLEEEAIQLRLGQRVGAFELDRILRREHEERVRQRVADGAHGDRVLLHRFEQRRLRLGRRAVDLVGQDQVGEDRPGLELKGASRSVLRLQQDVGAQDVSWHQVGRELDAAVLQLQRSRNGAHEQCLAQPRQPFQQHVAAGQQRDGDSAHHHLLADDDARHLAFERFRRLAQALERRGVRAARLGR